MNIEIVIINPASSSVKDSLRELSGGRGSVLLDACQCTGNC